LRRHAPRQPRIEVASGRDVPLDGTAPELPGASTSPGFGSDASVLIKRRGYVVTEMPRRWRNIDTMQLAGAVKAEYDIAGEHKPKLIDSIGIGLPVLGVNVGEQPSSKEQFMRLRDERGFKLKEWLATRRCRLSKDDQLRDDLCAPRSRSPRMRGFRWSRRTECGPEDCRLRTVSTLWR
jgi:hypothetical protein